MLESVFLSPLFNFAGSEVPRKVISLNELEGNDTFQFSAVWTAFASVLSLACSGFLGANWLGDTRALLLFIFEKTSDIDMLPKQFLLMEII